MLSMFVLRVEKHEQIFIDLFLSLAQVFLVGNPTPLSWAPVNPGGGLVVLLPELPYTPAQAWTLELDLVQ